MSVNGLRHNINDYYTNYKINANYTIKLLTPITRTKNINANYTNKIS